MTPQTAILELKLRLNKIDSQDYENIPKYVAVKAINKGQLEWTRKQIHGSNPTQEGDEESRVRVDDLQILLTEVPLKGNNKELYFESDPLPANYLAYKRVLPRASKGACQGIIMETILVEEANVSTYLGDWSMQPSFDFGQTFHTLVGNKIRIYKTDFDIDNNSSLMYYRKPRAMDIAGYVHEDGSASKNVNLEFKDDVCSLILDAAASIIAGDTESFNTAQNTENRADKGN